MFTNFNRILLASGLVLTSLVGFGSTAFAQSADGGDIGVEVPEVEILTWTGTKTLGSPQQLTLYTALTETVVGAVNVKSNTAAGFEVSVTSDNDGVLIVGSSVNTYEQMPYTLYYDSDSVTLTAGTGTAENSAFDGTCASTSGCNRNVSISIDQTDVDGKAAGIYSDILTFTLANN